jgi:hypothetical protein
MFIQYQPTKDTKMKVHEISEKRAGLVAEMRGLLNAGDKLSPEHQIKFDSLKNEVTCTSKARKPAPDSSMMPSAARWVSRTRNTAITPPWKTR